MIVPVEARCLVAVLTGGIKVGHAQFVAVADVDRHGERELKLAVRYLASSREGLLGSGGKGIDGCLVLHIALVGGKGVERIVEDRVEESVERGIDQCLAARLEDVSPDGDVAESLQLEWVVESFDRNPVDVGNLDLLFRIGECQRRVAQQTEVEFVVVRSKFDFRRLDDVSQSVACTIAETIEDIVDDSLVEQEILLGIDHTDRREKGDGTTIGIEQQAFAHRNAILVPT